MPALLAHTVRKSFIVAAVWLLAFAPMPATAQTGLPIPGAKFIEKQLKKLTPGQQRVRKRASPQEPGFSPDEKVPLPGRNRLRGHEQRLERLQRRQEELQKRQEELAQKREAYRKRRQAMREEARELRRLNREVRKRKREMSRLKRKLNRQQKRAKRIKVPQPATPAPIEPSPAAPAPTPSPAAAPTPQESEPQQPRVVSLEPRPWPRSVRPEREAATEDAADALPPLPSRRPKRKLSEIKVAAWTPAFIQQAKNECQALLGNAEIRAQPLPPRQEGRCGAPAPLLLTHISKSNPVEIAPAATLSCRMVAGLMQWITEDVQPLAKRYLDAELKKIGNVSSYVCRRRYGDTNTRISEHAYANALDIAYFGLSDGRHIALLGDWGEKPGDKPTGENEKRSAFLRALHKSACARFGTVLGPEANEAHRDHFHLDMKPRRRGSYCR